MKKFTKGCLITALILFIFGCAFWGICGYMGGFRQLENTKLSRERILSIGWNGIRWGYNGNWFSIWDDDDFDDDWWPETAGTPNLVEVGDNVRTSYHASDITDIDIELGGTNLIMKESEDEYIWIANNSNAKTVKYTLGGGEFKLYYGRSVNLWNDIGRNGNICLYLPKGMKLNTIDLEMGAGNLESIDLAANEIDMEIGAGDFTIEGMQGNSLDISVAAGNADIGEITAGTVCIEAGAGEITIDNISARELQMEAGAGNIEVKGSIDGNIDIDCGVGNTTLVLQGDVEDYNYQIECALGNISIDGSEYGGIIDERNINNGSNKEIDIECATGNIEISFVK